MKPANADTGNGLVSLPELHTMKVAVPLKFLTGVGQCDFISASVRRVRDSEDSTAAFTRKKWRANDPPPFAALPVAEKMGRRAQVWTTISG